MFLFNELVIVMEIYALVLQASKPNWSLGPWAFTPPSHTVPKGQGFQG
jgi:hypothetical protein